MIETARAIFAVPPFPGAKPHTVVRAAEPNEKAAAAPDTLIAALRRHRIGGPFWLSQEPAAAEEVADPWSRSQDAWTSLNADDPRVLLAAIIGQPVHVEGAGLFAALSGAVPGAAETETVLQTLVARHLLDGIAYHDPYTGAPTSVLSLVEIFAAWRALIDANRPIAAAFGFAHWKRDTVDPLLWGGESVPFRPARESVLADLPDDAAVAVWKARVPAPFLAQLEAGPWRLLEVEDGFIRSAGLGADCVPPLSILVDDLGVHYDPARPNHLEEMLAAGDFSPDDLARAHELRAWLVREGVSKYGVGAGADLSCPVMAGRLVLVVGQVEDDRSVLFGGGPVRSNLELLRHVRALEPDAHLIYRPHPDVEAGHRRGAIPTHITLNLADSIDTSSPISALIALVDAVHVITSLAGFEALLQGKPVTTHGVPFFAGWGLTRDLAPVPSRRGVTRTLDELVAAVLLSYPRYLDPVTNLPCTAEILVTRLLSGIHRQNVAIVSLRRLVGWVRRAKAQILGMR